MVGADMRLRMFELQELYPPAVLAYAAAVVEDVRMLTYFGCVYGRPQTWLRHIKVMRDVGLPMATNIHRGTVAECLANRLFRELL